LPTYALQPRDALEAALKEAYDAHDAAHGIPRREEETKDGSVSTDERNTRPRLTLEELAPVVPTLCNWRVDDETLARLRAALNKYVGTHNYHNFTSRMKPTDKSAIRYMLSFECSDPMIDEVTGQGE
jgi:tRNA U38,U39,U40 pseudouridine synthase TruA